jgi:hypothetical protein
VAAGDLAGGQSADVALELPGVEARGHHTVKLDLVSEGIDWFERCGSATTLKTFWVR